MAHMNYQNTTFSRDIRHYYHQRTKRSITEAFPRDVEYACAIVRNANDHQQGLPVLAWVVLIVVGAALAFAVVT